MILFTSRGRKALEISNFLLVLPLFSGVYSQHFVMNTKVIYVYECVGNGGVVVVGGRILKLLHVYVERDGIS